jgi:small GTP-binding protein
MSSVLDAKVVLLGATSVGKTSMINRAVSNDFDQNQAPTVGATYFVREVEVQGVTVGLQIWDTAGQERFRTLAPMYYRGAVVAILVFSLTDTNSLGEVKKWADEIVQMSDDMPKLFVVGNKLDLADDRSVTPDDGESAARDLRAVYFEISAKTGRGIEDLVVRIAEEAFRKLKQRGELGVLGSDRSNILLKTTGEAESSPCSC